MLALVLGLAVAAVVVYFWARGSMIVAIMGTLAALLLAGASGAPGALTLLVPAWAPYLIWRRIRRPVSMALALR